MELLKPAPLNKVIKILILSDFFIVSAWGFVAPILAIFIVENIKGGDVGVAGAAVGVYWLTKSILQIPIGKYLDRNHGEKDDYYFLVIGTLIAGFVQIGFVFSQYPWHLYLLQVIHAVGYAMAIPAWGGIFIRHIDQGKEAFTWGAESSSIGVGAGLAGIAGGMIAKTFGFTPLFIGAGLLTISGTLLYFLISQNLLPKSKVVPISKAQL